MRQIFVLIHRYVGLVMSLFLVVAGITGMFIAFYDELEALIHPELMLVQPTPHLSMIDPITLSEKVQQQYPNAWISRVDLHQRTGNSAVFFLQPRPGLPESSMSNNQIFVNPYTGELLGERKWGDITQGTINLMPFIYRLHFSLALGVVGSYTFGVIALLWTLDCFVGAYLTFPAKGRQPQNKINLITRILNAKSWLGRWRKSWKVRWHGGLHKISFDLHRAGGLWVWAMLFVFAWSSVAFNLTEVYAPVMKSIFASQKIEDDLPSLAQPLLKPALNWQTALRQGRAHMQQASEKKHFTVNHEGRISYNANKGIYTYSVNSSLDVSEKSQQTEVIFNADNGTLVAQYFPTGTASANTITEWLIALHMAMVWGLPMQIFISFMGFVVAGLSITGIYIWFKKRNSSLYIKQQRLTQI
jgi:uncharacterized iron-regulated membrane protein